MWLSRRNERITLRVCFDIEHIRGSSPDFQQLFLDYYPILRFDEIRIRRIRNNLTFFIGPTLLHFQFYRNFASLDFSQLFDKKTEKCFSLRLHKYLSRVSFQSPFHRGFGSTHPHDMVIFYSKTKTKTVEL